MLNNKIIQKFNPLVIITGSIDATKAKMSLGSYLASSEVVEVLSSESMSLYVFYIDFLLFLGLGQS